MSQSNAYVPCKPRYRKAAALQLWKCHRINPAGEVTGWYSDSGDRRHGYVRDNKCTITTFDAPCAGTDAFQGTFPDSGPNIINPAGAIVGYYYDANFVAHGFVRDSDGTITTFDAPGAGSVTDSGQGTYPISIDPAGAIAGSTLDASNVYHGFLRAPDGTFTTFDAPGAGSVTDSGQGTTPSSINPAGAIAGSTLDANFVGHGFVRDRDGNFTTFDVPGAGNATDSFQGTFPRANNPSGKITGFYLDSGNLPHGFLRTP
jgi:hypothetical protein